MSYAGDRRRATTRLLLFDPQRAREVGFSSVVSRLGTSHWPGSFARLQPVEPSCDGDTVFSHTCRAIAGTQGRHRRGGRPTSNCPYRGSVYYQGAGNGRACTSARITPTRDIESERPGIQHRRTAALIRCAALSPNRSEIVLVSGGDIWTVAAAGGDARLLVSHDANEPRRSTLQTVNAWHSFRPDWQR